MARWMWGAFIAVGVISSLGLGLWATPVEVTTQDQLLFALDQACTRATELQTASQVLCNQVKERLEEKLQDQLRQRGSIKIDPTLLGKVMAWTAQWNREGQPGAGVDEALQLAIGLTGMLNQGAYGEKLHELLAYGQAAGYTPEEMTVLVTQIARMVTAQTPAGDVLDEALGHLEKAAPGEKPEKVLEAVQQRINDKHDIFQEASNEAKNHTIGQPKGSAGNGLKLGLQPPSNRGKGAGAPVPNVMDKKLPIGNGPELAGQPPSSKGEGTEVSASTATDEGEGEGAFHGHGHKGGNAAKKNH